ncbi:hypothetical protein PAXRUDRAFT_581080 [Paxillus rubicundulus Ve08.2h10]|uniref:Secreted protein n=1 Tax=Paxillus rubicundulus Ve08.2h10 TaxID=930991 RepID=A0A0D0D6B4_9AGAM|nr:hypothetical protein PAXRUDRAFT_581080 [Paxillus rubicundulus Ve08.2h10]
MSFFHEMFIFLYLSVTSGAVHACDGVCTGDLFIVGCVLRVPSLARGLNLAFWKFLLMSVLLHLESCT